MFFFFSSRRRHTRLQGDWSSDVCSSDLKHHGMLVGYAAFKEHCSLFMSTALTQAHKKALAPYQTSKGTIRFTIEKPLPAALVRKLVKARIAQNEAKIGRASCRERV